MVHYFLCKKADLYYRIGTKGDKKAGEEYLNSITDCTPTYIGEFVDVIYSDIDNMIGRTEKHFNGGSVVSCKLVFQLKTSKYNGDYFAYLARFHEELKESVKKEYERRKERERVKSLKATKRTEKAVP